LLLSITLSAVVSLFSFSVLAETENAKNEHAEDQKLQTNGIGDWVGTLNVPGGKLRLWLSVELDSKGELLATLESLDQAPGKKMVVKEVKVEENKLSFFIPRISASYSGEWHPKTKQWQGTFTQGQSFELNFFRGKPQSNPIYSNLDGQWQGEIMGHPLIVRIFSGNTGTAALLDSPDEGVRGLPITGLNLDGNKVSFEITKAKVKFSGILDEATGQFSGQWIQKGQPQRDLTFIKQSKKKQSTTAPSR